MTKEGCEELQKNILAILTPDSMPDRIASFGNTLAMNVEDWVKVVDVKPTAVVSCWRFFPQVTVTFRDEIFVDEIIAGELQK